MAKRGSLVDTMLAEVVSYGGLPVTRATAHRLAMEAVGARGADMFAFGPNVRRLDCDAMTYDEAAAIVR